MDELRSRAPDTEPSRLADEACGWLARLRSESITDEERSRFEAWKSASPAHQRAWDDVTALWHDPQLRRAALYVKRRSRPRLASPLKLAIQRTFAVASVLLLLVGISAGILLYTAWQADYTTRVGEQAQLSLSDGTIVRLNTHTALSVNLAADDERQAHLLWGEAFFEVAPDERRPFVVHFKDIILRALGTKFVVRTDNQIRVSVTEGAIELRLADNGSRVVSEGQQVVIEAGGVHGPDPLTKAEVMSWVEGRLVFEDAPLAKVIAEIRRYHKGYIFLMKDAEHVKVTGTYFLRNPAAIIDTLVNTLPIRLLRITDHLLVVY